MILVVYYSGISGLITILIRVKHLIVFILSLYKRKQVWKVVLLVMALAFVALSFVFTNIFVQRIAQQERESVKTWADAIHRKASLVNYQNGFFNKIMLEERNHVEHLAEAAKRVVDANNDEELSFYARVIADNKTIPVIWTDERGNIKAAQNTWFDHKLDSVRSINGAILREFRQYKPIRIEYVPGMVDYLYYKESILYSELREVLSELINSFFSYVIK